MSEGESDASLNGSTTPHVTVVTGVPVSLSEPQWEYAMDESLPCSSYLRHKSTLDTILEEMSEVSDSTSDGGSDGGDASISIPSGPNYSTSEGTELRTTSISQHAHIPGKLIFLIQSSDSLFRVNILINGETISAVVDTGATKSLISEVLAKQCGLDIFASFGNLKVINDVNFHVVGETIPTLSINSEQLQSVSFLVFPNINSYVSVVLGIDFLELNRIEISPSEKKLTKHFNDGGGLELYFNEVGDVIRKVIRNVPCFVTTNTKISSDRLTKVPITFPVSDTFSDCVLYTDDIIDPHLSNVTHGCDGVCSSDVKSILMIASDSNIELRKGQCVGTISTIFELPECTDSISSSNWNDETLREVVKLPNLDDNQREVIYKMLSVYANVLSVGDHDIGNASVTEHHIKLYNDTPIYQRPRRFPTPISDEIESQCKELSTLDIIEPSISPWASPVVPIRKKDGSIRLCIDYRKLNEVTVPDKFPMPNLTDSIFGLNGTKFFTRFDLVRGYYQLPIDKESREYTAFCTPRNHWQFKRLSFGLRNAPAAFQREIQAVLRSFPSNKVIAYIDDILIMGSSFEEHFALVSKVLESLQAHCIKIKPCKCEWFQYQVEYLGHVVSRTGIRKTASYLSKVESYPQPTTVGELREFLGFVNFQRKFLPRCSELQKPLSCLTSGKRNKSLTWTNEMTDAFRTLKCELCNDLELSYPDYSENANKLELWVDASASGAGAYLAQDQGGCHRVIGFASMCFSPTQMHYSTLERELTGLRWGVKTFRPFLYGIEFILFTDHQPLVHLHNMKLVCSRLARTVEELSDFNFEIRYTPGHLNCAADALSRLPNTSNVINDNNYYNILPDGLVICGLPAPGGGDSLFISLHRLLLRLNCGRKVPNTEFELRQELVSDLLTNPQTYKIKLTRQTRKEFKQMTHRGQLPSLDILLVVSKLYHVRVYVYFWSEQPIVYQYDTYPCVLYVQCVSGVHFNPLVELKDFETPSDKCTIVSVGNDCETRGKNNLTHADCVVEEQSDTDVGDRNILMTAKYLDLCNHECASHPQVIIEYGQIGFCGLLDTGAEISLVSGVALERISCSGLQMEEENMCDIIGISGVKRAISQVVRLQFKIGDFSMGSHHKFAIVGPDVMPCCFLLGLDFLNAYNLSIDLSTRSIKRNSLLLTKFIDSHKIPNINMALTVLTEEFSKSHTLVVSEINSDIRFEIAGFSNTVTGLSLLINDDTICHIQDRDSDLKLLKNCVKNKIPCNSWPLEIASFKRHFIKLSIVNNVLVYNNLHSVIVVTFAMFLELALVLHYKFAHVGRDKLLDLMDNSLWHPSRFKTVSDVCTTCPKCQLLKVSSTPIIPPTLKIVTSYPFEMVAADLTSLPQTSSGFVGCLVLVDHYSKWVCAVPIRNKRSATIVESLKNRVFPFLPKVPTKLLTDNGPEFISSEFAAFLNDEGIIHQLTTPYHPSSNGAVERVNRTIQSFLRGIECEGGNWDKHLPKAISVYNNTLHSELNMSPSMFLLTKAHKMDNIVPVDSEITKKWRLGHPKFLSFEIGETVIMKRNKIGNLSTNKLEPNYKGPFKVLKVNNNGVTYQLFDECSGNVIRAHHTDLHLFKIPPSYVSDHPFYKLMNNIKTDDMVVVGTGTAVLDVGVSSSEDPHVCELGTDQFGITDSSSVDSLSESFSGFESEDSGNNCAEQITHTEIDENIILCNIAECPCCSCEKFVRSKAVERSNENCNISNTELSLSVCEINELREVKYQPILDWNCDFYNLSFTDSFHDIPTVLDDCDPNNVDPSCGVDVQNNLLTSNLTLLDESVPLLDIDNPITPNYPLVNCENVVIPSGADLIGNNSSDSISKLENFIDSTYNEYSFAGGSNIVEFDRLKSKLVKDDFSKILVGSTPLESECSPVSRRQTRSAGPVANLPHVQPRILERKYKATLDEV